MITVMNLNTQEMFYYGENQSPKEALLRTYFKETLKNSNSWTYKELFQKYMNRITESKLCFSIGDFFAVFQDGREFN